MKFNFSFHLLKGLLVINFFICVMCQAFSQTLFVSPDGDDRNNGESWQSPKQTIQAAINVALSGSRIFIQAGSYRFQNLVIPPMKDLELYGGFLGFEKDPSERPKLPSVEDREEPKYQKGQTDINGFTDGGARTQRHGVYVRDPGNIVLDRLTIRGWANPNNVANEYGAGIFVVSNGFQESDFTVKDCVITDNDARFSSGLSGGDGGGMYFSGGGTLRISVFENLICRNYSRSCGAGICVIRASGIVARNVGKNNADEEFGGFAFLGWCNEIDFMENDVINNAVQFPAEGGVPSGPGGGIMGVDSRLRISRNRIIGNISEEGGGLFF